MSAVAAIVATITADPAWDRDPARIVHRYIGRAADAHLRRLAHETLAPGNDPALSTHVACALVAAADSPRIVRGAALDDLVSVYGSGM